MRTDSFPALLLIFHIFSYIQWASTADFLLNMFLLPGVWLISIIFSCGVGLRGGLFAAPYQSLKLYISATQNVLIS